MDVFDTRDNLDLLEEAENRGWKQLADMKFEDPNRSKVLNEVLEISKRRLEYQQADENRLSNNRKNDIEEEKLVIEKEKVENEKQKVTNEKWKIGIMPLIAFGGGIISYYMDDIGKLVYKPMKTGVDKVIDFFIRR